MKRFSIILTLLMIFTTSAAFAEHEPSHRDSSSKFNGALPAIGVGVVVVGLTATYFWKKSEGEEGEAEFVMMLNESTKWVNEHTVPDERGLSFKLFEW